MVLGSVIVVVISHLTYNKNMELEFKKIAIRTLRDFITLIKYLGFTILWFVSMLLIFIVNYDRYNPYYEIAFELLGLVALELLALLKIAVVLILFIRTEQYLYLLLTKKNK